MDPMQASSFVPRFRGDGWWWAVVAGADFGIFRVLARAGCFLRNEPRTAAAPGAARDRFRRFSELWISRGDRRDGFRDFSGFGFRWGYWARCFCETNPVGRR